MGLAVSGGPDSLALLLMAAAALPGQVEAATVDHQLRKESAAEAAAVARICQALGVEHRILPVTVASGNLQSHARTARYAALAQWMERRNMDALATAHHADDQAETLLMRLNRASGVAGLAGVRARTTVPGTNLLLLRPLLDWRRAELQAIVSASGFAAAQDPSNSDLHYDRVQLRQALITAPWLNVGAIAASAEHLADADAALDWAAQREWDSIDRSIADQTSFSPHAPKAITLRLITSIITKLGGSRPRGGDVARLYAALLRGETATLGGVKAQPKGGQWHFSRVAPHR